MTRRHALAAVVLIAALMIGMALFLSSRYGPASGSSPPVVHIGSATGTPNSDVTVSLEVRDVPSPGVAAGAVEIVYGPGVTPTGYTKGGDWSLADCNLTFAPNTIRCSFLHGTGLTGTHLIADITFHIESDASGCAALDVQTKKFVDKDNTPIDPPPTDEDGEICIPVCDDADGDGVCDLDDDCPNTQAGQEVDVNGCPQAEVDQDQDGKCDPGKSSPSWCTGSDNCPAVANPGQENHDGDPQGDACDLDDDNDGVTDAAEAACGSDPLDAGSKCEVCDGADNDKDGHTDEGFPNNDGDAQADCVDPDDDNDSVTDTAEAACGSDPLDANSKCEVCDGADNDKDGHTDEGFPNNDGDAQADCVDPDDDNDAVLDVSDNCPFVANGGQADLDEDGTGDACDVDIDGDDVSNEDEQFYGSDPQDDASTPESLGWDQTHDDDTCTNGVDDDGDATKDASESDGPDAGTDGDCAVAVTPTPKPTATPTPTVTPVVGPAIPMVTGWNDRCYVGDSMDVEDALDGIAAKVLAIYILNSSQAFDRWFPDRSDVSTITSLDPYDQLLVLMSGPGTWQQEQTSQTPSSVNLIQGWNSVCYVGETKPVEEATAGIADDIGILYRLLDTQVWARYVPNRPDVSDISTLTQTDSVLVLVTREGGIEWVFDP